MSTDETYVRQYIIGTDICYQFKATKSESEKWKRIVGAENIAESEFEGVPFAARVPVLKVSYEDALMRKKNDKW